MRKGAKDIPGYEGLYSVDPKGNVYSNRRHYNEVTQRQDKWGYCVVALSVNGKNSIKLVHRLVAKTFIPNPDNLPEVNHIDGDKMNNRVKNLEWVTHSENMKHAYATGLHKPQPKKPPKPPKPPEQRKQRRGRKLTMEIAQSIRQEYIKRQKGHTIKALADKYNVDTKTIRDILLNKIWRVL